MRRRSHSHGHKKFSVRTQELRPGDFPIGSVESRAAARGLLPQTQIAYTLILAVPDLPLHLESSSWERFRWPKGEICELVYLDGRASDISQEQLLRQLRRDGSDHCLQTLAKSAQALMEACCIVPERCVPQAPYHYCSNF